MPCTHRHGVSSPVDLTCAKTYPGIGIDGAGTTSHIRGDARITWPKEHANEGTRPLYGVPTSAVGIERRPERVAGRGKHGATRIPIGVNITVCGERRARHAPSGRHGAGRRRVNGHGVRGLAVNTFDPAESYL